MGELVNQILKQCSPYADFNFITDSILGERKGNFIGGNGDYVRTKHEKVFKLLYPNLLEQVSFGTGVGGYEKYTFKRVVVDFYDEKNKLAIEIDGNSHKRYSRQLKDKMKELMLLEVYGIKTIRFTNEEVEELLKKRVRINANRYWKSKRRRPYQERYGRP